MKVNILITNTGLEYIASLGYLMSGNLVSIWIPSLRPLPLQLPGTVRSISLLLLQLEVVLAVHHYIDLCPVAQVPHPPVLVQQPGVNLHRVVACSREGQEELRLEIVLLYGLCSLQGDQI